MPFLRCGMDDERAGRDRAAWGASTEAAGAIDGIDHDHDCVSECVGGRAVQPHPSNATDHGSDEDGETSQVR